MTGAVKPVRVLVVDDDPAIRTLLGDVLDQSDTLECAGLAADGAGAIRMVRGTAAEVVLMDINMPVMDGYEATRRLVAGRVPVRVLMLTAIEDPDVIARAIQSGSYGVLLKTADTGAIVEAVHAVMAGIRVMSESPTSAVLGAIPVATGDILLTPREKDVLEALTEGDDSTDDLMRRFVLSEATVKKHVASLMRKLGAKNRTGVVVRGLQEGVAKLPQRRLRQ